MADDPILELFHPSGLERRAQVPEQETKSEAAMPARKRGAGEPVDELDAFQVRQGQLVQLVLYLLETGRFLDQESQVADHPGKPGIRRKPEGLGRLAEGGIG